MGTDQRDPPEHQRAGQRGGGNSLRQQGIWISPFPVSPFGGQAGAGGFPPRRSTSRGQQKALARAMRRLPPQEGLPPPCASPA